MKAPANNLHVAVIGAGALGGWTAYALLEAGARVTLLDARGAGHSGASSGGESRILRCVYGEDRLYADLTRQALDLWEAFDRRWDHNCWAPTGALWLLTEGSGQYLQESADALRERDWPLLELAVASLEKRYPALSTQGVRRAWLEPRAGLLRAAMATRAVANACQRLGADYRILQGRPGPIRRQVLEYVETSDGSHLRADAYVFACGPWLRSLFPDLLQGLTRVSRQEVYFFQRPPGDRKHAHPQLPIWLEYGDPFFYGLPLDTARGFKVADDDRAHPFDPERDDRSPSPWRLERARQWLARRFPGLAGAPLQESRVCPYLNSRDGHFVIDRHPEAANCWLAGAGSGHAFKMGPALGRYLGGRVLDQGQAIPQFGLARFAGAHRVSYNQFTIE